MSAAAEASERAVFDDDDDDGDAGTDADDSEFDDDLTPPPPPAAPLPPPTAEIKIEDHRRSLVPLPDDSRRLFQRLWTDDDEIKILRGFLEFTTQRGTTFASHQYDTGPFYDRIKRELQLDFSKNQLIEKLRRLKKKFRNAAARIAAGKESVFKSPHDQATFEISRKIWSAGLKNGRDSDDDDINTHTPHVSAADPSAVDAGVRSSRSRRRRVRRRIEDAAVEAHHPIPVLTPGIGIPVVEDPARILALPPVAPIPIPAAVPNVIEETVKGCLGPLFKELMASVVGSPGLGFGGLGVNCMLGPGGNLLNPVVMGKGVDGDEKWRKQQILELEVYSRRLELLQEHTKSTLEELRSASTGNTNLEEVKSAVTVDSNMEEVKPSSTVAGG